MPGEAVDYAYRFAGADRLYLNVTNRCTNRCDFCVRRLRPGLGDGKLWGGSEPDLEALLADIERRGGLGDYSEVVWCGYGEPTFRLDLMKELAPKLRSAGVHIRLDTNGHANLIHGRDVIPELATVVDEVWVSLNAPDEQTYIELCDPGHDLQHTDGSAPQSGQFWEATLQFVEKAVSVFDAVGTSVVGHTLKSAEIESCKRLSESLGCERLRVR